LGGNCICAVPDTTPELGWRDSSLTQNIPAMSISALAGIRTEKAPYTSQKLYSLSKIDSCKRYKNCAIKKILSTLTSSKQRVLHGPINQLHGAELFRGSQFLRYSRHLPLFV
jgi:hypothetical protein